MMSYGFGFNNYGNVPQTSFTVPWWTTRGVRYESPCCTVVVGSYSSFVPNYMHYTATSTLAIVVGFPHPFGPTNAKVIAIGSQQSPNNLVLTSHPYRNC